MTIRAIMRTLTDQSIPNLYVKSIASRAVTPQAILRFIFNHVREVTPCLLIFEDIDSIVTEEVKSYFFNEVDGLEMNHGILMLGTTNHRKQQMGTIHRMHN
jgi:AAA+ superfamily predicted ATPase